MHNFRFIYVMLIRKCNYAKLTRFSAHFQLDKVLTLELSSPGICIRDVTIHYLGVLIYCSFV